jgi:LmbE family N-acetylglucosaminyl deacetylase
MADVAPGPTALLLSPHPDDELLGCPAHLFALRDAGWRIVNLALSLGRDRAAHPRRRRELELACQRAGFELVLADPGDFVMPDSRAQSGERPSGDGLELAGERVLELARRLDSRLLVAPSPHDDHPAHEWTGRLALSAARRGAARRLWLWGLWADVGLPNSLCTFDARRLAEIEHALGAHSGELDRNDYGRLLRARAQSGSVLLPERVFGYGTPGLPDGTLAEAVCEVHLGAGGELLLGAPAMLDGGSFGAEPAPPAIGVADWLDGPSPRRAVDGLTA